MKGDHIFYKEGYKYQLYLQYTVQTQIKGFYAKTDYLELFPNGVLTINKSYAWDGPSGPTIDTKDSMRGSLVHDALYQLMRLGLISQSCRCLADEELHIICLEDGMWPFRAEIWEKMVKAFAAGAAKSGTEPLVLVAPEALWSLNYQRV